MSKPAVSLDSLVVSVEHASHRVPARLVDLGLPRALLASHHGWDPGAATVGRIVARRFAAPIHLGRWSRLVADLNRSDGHPRVVPASLSGGRRRIPANADLDRAARADRIERFWRPYRAAVEAELDAQIDRHGLALHLSVHSFVERLGGEERRNDFGLLYHPRHPGERALAERLDARLTAQGFAVRRNYPYRGVDDGFCMRMRAQRPWDTYLGMEVELNQRRSRSIHGARRLAAALIDALRTSVG